ncbi:MAG: matrixin family metalloprotease [Polyangiaceae bacterium]
MRSALRYAMTFGAAGFAFAVSAHSQAFCRTNICDPLAEACELVDGCITGGKPVEWASSKVSWDVQQDDSARGLTSEALELAMTQAFERWTNVECPGGGKPSIEVVNRGPVACSKPEYSQTEPNANIVTFHDAAWPYTDKAIESLALTTLFFQTGSGEIYDANVEINTHDNEFALSDVAAPRIDLNAVLTHQVGHFFGLSHSADSTATMAANYDVGMTTLEADDIAAICAVFPPDRIASSDSDLPRHGFSGECASDGSGAAGAGSATSPDRSGCSIPLAAPSLSHTGPVLTLLASLLFLDRRRKLHRRRLGRTPTPSASQ